MIRNSSKNMILYSWLFLIKTFSFKSLNIYYLYLFLINLGFFLEIFNFSRLYGLLILSVGIIIRKWNLVYIKNYDLFYFAEIYLDYFL